jgi:hypothetical protein
MAFLGKGVHLLKGSAKFGLYGVGIILGLGVAMAVAKQSTKGCAALCDRIKTLKKKATGEVEIPEEGIEENIDIMGVEPAMTAPKMEEIQSPVTSSPPAVKKKAAVKRRKGSKPSAKWSKAELYAKAKELGIAGRSAMSKQQLLKAVTS